MDAVNLGPRITRDLRNNPNIGSYAEALEAATEHVNSVYDQLMDKNEDILKDRGVHIGSYISGTRNTLYKVDEIHKGVDESFQPFFSLNCRLVLEFSHDLKKVALGGRKSFHCESEWRPAVEADIKAVRRRRA